MPVRGLTHAVRIGTVVGKCKMVRYCKINGGDVSLQSIAPHT